MGESEGSIESRINNFEVLAENIYGGIVFILLLRDYSV